ncbi:hypothetical protein RhiirA4_443907 [Rhizophagus irregularis]|uniref:Uncharacterized protein n=1 Tax=Rhizophagus irregularis TaxID=588596 RepID=A0A2I1GGF4_9GLOM|nr:hypothetical protein RhiirA4_443907 [Rhizophagus irregularis]
MAESQNIGSLINIARILLFAFSLVCFTIDTNKISTVNSIESPFGSIPIPKGSSGFGSKIDSQLNGFKSVLAFSVFNDLVSFLISAYYVVMIEKKRNQEPNNYDYIVCGVELLLWIIYVFYNQKRSQSQNHRTPIGRTNNDSGTNNATTIEVHQT